MRRLLFSLFLAAAAVTATVAGISACSSAASANRFPAGDDASPRDGSPVDPADGSAPADGAVPGPQPECTTYCDAVLESCKDRQAQYASKDECLAFCARLPAGKAGDSEGSSVACRQFYAGSPARTDSATFCGAAGPFGGGGICGERCPIFCELAMAACSATGTDLDGGPPPYSSYADCQTTCLGFAYKDGGVDGGGEIASGPSSGNTLNCRLYYLRDAVTHGQACANLGLQSPACD